MAPIDDPKTDLGSAGSAYLYDRNLSDLLRKL